MRFLVLLLPIGLFAGWAEETLEKMTLEEKVGQLIMAPACPKRGEDHWDDWMRILLEHHVGNAIAKQSDPISQAAFLNRLQEMSKLPLLISGDTEWGLAMRMEGTMAFPKQMTLGAVSDLSLIYEMGKEIGRQARCVGIHLCLAPVADVNHNPQNPIIHMRSFGEDAGEVAIRVSAYAKGLAEAGVMACAKHFPGHGDTSVDSHQDLPCIPYERERLEAVEWVPFKQAIDSGIGSVMSAHLLVPCLDGEFPFSLSPQLKKVLRKEMGFEGLIVSDALNMKALSDRFSPEEAAVLTRRAGTDLLLYGDHIDPKVDALLKEMIPRACEALKKAYRSGDLDCNDLDESVLRILRAKEKLGLHEVRFVPGGDLFPESAVALKKRLFEEAVTLIGELPELREGAAYLSFGDDDALGEKFSAVFEAPLQLDLENKNTLLEQLIPFDQVVIALHQADLKAKNFGLSDEALGLIKALASRSILCHFASPYTILSHPSLLIAYENDPAAQEAVCQTLKKARKPNGSLPVAPLSR